MGPIVCSETAVKNYHSTLRKIPRYRISLFFHLISTHLSAIFTLIIYTPNTRGVPFTLSSSKTHLSHRGPAYGSTCRDGCCVQGTDKRNSLHHSFYEDRVVEIDGTRGTYRGEGEMAN